MRHCPETAKIERKRNETPRHVLETGKREEVE